MLGHQVYWYVWRVCDQLVGGWARAELYFWVPQSLGQPVDIFKCTTVGLPRDGWALLPLLSLTTSLNPTSPSLAYPNSAAMRSTAQVYALIAASRWGSQVLDGTTSAWAPALASLFQRGTAQLAEAKRTMPAWQLPKPVRVRDPVPLPEAHTTLPAGSKRTGLIAIKAGMTQVQHSRVLMLATDVLSSCWHT